MLLDPTYDRPADALGRGRWPTQPWVIITIASVTVVLVALVVTLRIRARIRRRRLGDGPISSRRGSLPPPSRR